MYGVVFLGVCGYATVAGIHKIENLDGEQLKMGFVYGLLLAICWTSFGLLGALCLGKFLVGFSDDFRTRELLVRYHDRLCDLRDLPDEGRPEADFPTSRSQPNRPETDRAPAAVRSGR